MYLKKIFANPDVDQNIIILVAVFDQQYSLFQSDAFRY